MTEKTALYRSLLIFGIPLLLILLCIFLASQIGALKTDANLFASAVTLDLAITVPIVYFFLIRKTTISKFTVMPFFVIGLILASLVIPSANQGTLDILKTWLLPIVELTVIILVVLKIRTIRRHFNDNKMAETGESSLDFVSVLKKSAAAVLPAKAASAIATEIGLFYYSFIAWKKPIYNSNHFTYHRESGLQGILGAILAVALIELFCVHLLIHESYPILSWVLSALSAYGVIQIFGLMKSIPRTPAYLTENAIVIRMGIFQETTISYNKIESVELTTVDYPKKDKTYQRITLFDHNCIIHLKEEATLEGLFGRTKKYHHLILSIDEKNRFKGMLEAKTGLTNEI